MILPIYAYGSTVLKKVGNDISPDYPGLTELIEDMWTTMYHAQGIGLAAPQIGRDIRLFIVDSLQLDEEDKPPEGLKKVFINAQMIEEIGPQWHYEEGCLSIPEIREKVERNPIIRLKYQDQNFEWHEETFDRLNARIIQHEYDHIDGILFTDHLKSLKKRLLKKRLDKISKGKIDVRYKMKFPLR